MRANRIWPIAKKEFFHMLRDRRTLIFILMTPLLQLIIIGYATSGQITNISLAIVDQSHTGDSRALIDAYIASGQFQAGPVVDSLADAKRAIDRGEARVAIVIPPEFGRDLGKGGPAEIGFLVDGTEPNTASTVLAASQLIGQSQSIRVLPQTLASHAQAFDVRTRVLYNPQLSAANYQIPALIGLILQLTTLNLTVEAIVRERETGTMEQLIVTPIKPIELIIGKLIPYACASLCTATLVFVAGVLFFQVPVNGNVLLLLGFMLLFLMVPLGAGLWISAISQTYRQAQALNLLFLLPGFLLSGQFFPIESMPRLLQFVTYLVPLRYFLAYADALKSLKNLQELDAQVVQTQTARDAAAAALKQARINTQATRDRLSAAKTQAEAQVKQSADALTQAQASYACAKSNWQYAQDTGNDPIQPKVCTQAGCKPNKLSDAQRTSYYTQFVQAESAMHQAEQSVPQALVAADAARQAEVAGVQTADEQTQAAQTNLDNAQRALDQVKSIRTNPQQLRAAADTAQAQRDTAHAGVEAARVQKQTAVDSAYTQLQSAEAQLAQARSRLDLAKAGSRAEQIQAAEAQLAQARAQVQQLEVQIGKATLKAPVDGIVLERVINLGEQATPGNILLKLGSLAKVKLTIYVPEDQIGPLQIRQGVHVRVGVDSFPERAFDGTITYIAPQAVFTPRNVQTREERATTVFPVRIELTNPDGALKPGMPADATVAR